MSARKPTSLQRLMAAMDACAVARGEAQWTNGYRTAIAKHDGAKELRMYNKEQVQWSRVTDTEAAFKRLAQRLLREARRERGA